MVSRPTHKPIPIPLSVRVEDDESFDSVDDLLASIRELVSPGAVDIIDLNRPVQPDSIQSRPAQTPLHPEKIDQTGPVQPGPGGFGACIATPEPLDPVYNLGTTEAFSSESVTPQMGVKRYLSEKTLSESTKVLSSLMSALEEPDQDAHTKPSAQGVQKPILSHNRDDQRMKGICVEDLVAQCLKAPLNQWIGQNDAVISQHVKTIIDQHITELLHQWLDTHLPEVIKASVDQHLDALIQSVRKQ